MQRVKNYKHPCYPVVRIGSSYENIKGSCILEDDRFNSEKSLNIEEIKSHGSMIKSSLAFGIGFNHAGIYLAGCLEFFQFQYSNQNYTQNFTYYERSNYKAPYVLNRKLEIVTNKTKYSTSFIPRPILSAAILLF